MTRLYLIGYRCTGKTSVGRELARRLGWAFADTDAILVEDLGMSITEMIAAQGWAGFRAAEREVLARISREPTDPRPERPPRFPKLWKPRRSLARINHAPGEADPRPGVVVATGGGVVLDPENVRRMRETGRTVWLRAAPETIRQRMAGDAATEGQRPPLTGGAADDEIERVLTDRTPQYAGAADLIVDTDNVDLDGIVRRLVGWKGGD